MVDEVNAAGRRLLGRKIEYIAEDDQTNAEAGVRAARKLIDADKVQTIMSVWASAVGSAVLPLCWENKVMMLGISAADSLALLPHQGYFVRTQPHTELRGKEFGRFALGAGREESLSDHAADALHRRRPSRPSAMSVEPKGVKVASMIIDGKKTSFRSEIDEAMRTNPDMFMMGGYQAENIVMAKDLFRANFKGQGDGLCLRHGLRPLSTAPARTPPKSMYGVAEPSPRGRLVGLCAAPETLVKKDTLDTYICQAYDHANLAILSMAKGKDASGTGIKDNIRKIANNDDAMKVDNALDGLKAIADGKEIKYAGASGPCKFSDIGNIIEVAFRTTQVKDGKLVEVKS